VVADPATVDPRFVLDEGKVEAIARVITQYWPEQIDPGDLGSGFLAQSVIEARNRLLEELGLVELA